ncbi:MAG: O-antigen ligase family protein [Roseiflexus sp.]
MNRLSTLVAPESIRTGSALLIGLTIAPPIGVLAATQPVLLLMLLGVAVWVFLVLRSDSSAPFVLGAAAPLLYLLDVRSALFSQAILALYGGAFVHALHQIIHQSDTRCHNRRLVLLTVTWGVIVALAERGLSGEELSLRRLVVAVIGMLPYLWFGMVAPRITGKQAHALLAGITTGAIITAAMFLLNSRALTEGLQGRDAWIDTYTVIGSLKNSLGLLWVIGWILLIGWRTREGWVIKAPLLAVLLAAVLFSFSRSSYVALIAATLLLYRGRSSALWIAIGTICAFVLFGLPEAVWARLEITWSPMRGFDPSAEARIELWIAAINAFLSAPLTGIGWGKFSDYLVRTGQAPAAAGQAVYDLAYAHNYFLSALAMLGVGGGVMSVGVFLTAWQRARALITHQVHLARTVQAVLLAVLLASLFGEPLFDPVLSFVFILILACLVGQESER